MPVARDQDLQDAADFARGLFLGDPQLGIDDVARMVNDNCRRGLIKRVIAEIRREVRQSKPTESTTMAAVEKLQNAAKHVPAGASAEARATKDARVQFLETWALENPLATIEQARQTVREKFGISLGTKLISDTLRMAKQLWEAQRREALEKHEPMKPPAPIAEAAQEVPNGQQQAIQLAQTMRAAGIRLLEILDDGRVRVEYKLD